MRSNTVHDVIVKVPDNLVQKNDPRSTRGKFGERGNLSPDFAHNTHLLSRSGAVVDKAGPDFEFRIRIYDHAGLTCTNIPQVKTIAITLDEPTLETNDELLKNNDVPGKNRSQIIRRVLQEYVASLERAAEEKREREVFHRNRRLKQQGG